MERPIETASYDIMDKRIHLFEFARQEYMSQCKISVAPIAFFPSNANLLDLNESEK